MHGQLICKNWEKNTGSCLILAKTVYGSTEKSGMLNAFMNLNDCIRYTSIQDNMNRLIFNIDMYHYAR